MEKLFNAMQGCQCPICKRVYSPFTQMCLYCGDTETQTTTYSNTSNGDFRDNTLNLKASNMATKK